VAVASAGPYANYLPLLQTDNHAVSQHSVFTGQIFIFVQNFSKNQWILMQSSLLDLKINGICDGMNITHLT